MFPLKKSRPEMRTLLVLGMPLLLAVATPVAAQSGQLPPPPPPAVSQSEPGYGTLKELHRALTVRQTNFNRMRQDHIARCDRIPPDDTATINWCRANVGRLANERSAYQTALKEYDAKQAFWQGRTLYLRKDYDGALEKYRLAQRLSFRAGMFDGNVLDEIDLVHARKAIQAGDMVTANNHLLAIEQRASACPSWLTIQIRDVFLKVRAWANRRSAKLRVRTPVAVCGVRG